MRKQKTSIALIFITGIITCLLLLLIFLIYDNDWNIEELSDPILITCKQIEEDNIGGKPFDLELLKDIYTKLNKRDQKNQNTDRKDDSDESVELTAEEYFILGYYEYKNYEDEKAIQHLHQSMELYTDSTDSFIKLATGVYLAVMNGDDVTQTIQQMDQIISELSVEDWNKNRQMIFTYFGYIMDKSEGRRYLIPVLKDILTKQEELSLEVRLNARNYLCVSYAAGGRYANALEQCLKVISLAESNNNTYYAAKAYVDMAAIYNAMDRFEMAQEWATRMVDFENESDQETAFIQSYAIQNILQALYGQNKIEEGQPYLQRLESMYPKFRDYEVAAFQAVANLYQAKAYLNQGEIQNAKVLLEDTERILELTTNSTALNVKTLYLMVEGQYLIALGEYEQASTILLEAYHMSEENASYNKNILKNLVNIYQETGQKKLFKKYYAKLLELYERENEQLNDDYCQYTVQKYYSDIENIKLQNKILQTRTSWVAAIACALFISSYAVMKVIYVKRVNRIDGLSRCYNRNYFDKQYLKVRSKQPMQLVMFDIDDFKKVNDHYGHVCGDDVLRQLGSIVKRVVGNKGKVFRYGGEEFVILTRMQSIEETYVLAEAIRTTVEKASWYPVDSITISLGIADTTRTSGDLIKAADDRLYHSKENGKNCTTVLW